MDLAGAGITTTGLLVMGFTPGMEFNSGDFLSFIMAIFYAFQVLAAGFGARRVEPYRLVALHIIMLAAVMTILACIFEPLPDIGSFSLKIWRLCSVFHLETRYYVSLSNLKPRGSHLNHMSQLYSRLRAFSDTWSQC